MKRIAAWAWRVGAVAALAGCVRGSGARAPIAVDVAALAGQPPAASTPAGRPSMQLAITEGLACLRSGGRVACARTEEDFWQLPRAASRSEDQHSISVSVAKTALADVYCVAAGYHRPPACAGDDSLALVGGSGLTSTVEISVGPVHACARQAEGDVWCWGAHDLGAIGTRQAGSPQRVPGLEAKRVVAGKAATCALTITGAVECWGAPVMGAQEPIGGPERVRVVGLDRATDLDGNGRAFCAVQGGEVLCWGHTHTLFPERERAYLRTPAWAGVARATRVRVGSTHACALTEEQLVVCWGYGSSGQLGPHVDPATAIGPQPAAPVLAVSGVVDIAVGQTLTCALLESGEIRCWGSWSGAPPKDLEPRPLG